jgi:hypothetical protein
MRKVGDLLMDFHGVADGFSWKLSCFADVLYALFVM